jgi:site-specific DNA recombinase
MKAAAYTRVSTSGQIGPDKTSLENQLNDIRDYCNFKKWELLPPYDESVASGASMDRPVLQRLLNDAMRGKFQAVVVADLSRFGRNLLHLKQNIEILKKHKIIFASLRENIYADEDSPMGNLIISTLATIYEFERETIKIRTSTNKNLRWKDKKIFIGHPPFGYRWDKETEKVEIFSKTEDRTYTDEAATYQYIVSQYLYFDKSLQAICDDLNDNKVSTRRKWTEWFVPVISRILRHTVYWTGTIITNQGKSVKEQIDYSCEPLISKAKWEAVQARLGSNKIRSGRPSKTADIFLLHGLVRCGMCGSKLQSIADSRQRQRDGGYLRYYACYYHKPSNAAEIHREPCVLPYIPADQVEKLAWDQLLMILSANVNKKKLIDNAHWAEKEARAEHKIKRCKDAWGAAKLAFERLEEAPKKPGKFDLEDFFELRAKYSHEMTQCDLELREAIEELNNLRQMREEEEKLIQFAKDRADFLHQIRDVLNGLPFSEKQRFIKGMLSFPIEIGIMQDLDWTENEDAEPPEEIGWKHWSEGFFVPFRFNWPLLQDILSRYLPPTPDGGGDGNGNLSPHRGPFAQIRAVAHGRRIGEVCGCARAGVAGKTDSAGTAFRRGRLLKFPDEAEALEKILPPGRGRAVDPGPGRPATGPLRPRISPDTKSRPDDSGPGSSGEHPFRSPARGDSIPVSG